MKQEFNVDDWIQPIQEENARAQQTANPDIDWPVPVISQYGERVHCWNSRRREFTITLSASEVRKVDPPKDAAAN
ncbi:hypothetical protein [Spirosoma pomorum]